MVDIIREIESGYLRDDIPEFWTGRHRQGARQGRRGHPRALAGVRGCRDPPPRARLNENFTIRRIASHGIGVERTFPIHAPRVDHIEVLRHGKVRRARLYFLRGRTGKAARIRERRRPSGSFLN